MHMYLHIHRAAIDAAHILLQAASTVPKLSLLCSMLTERAAVCYLHAGQTRKFAFYQTICGNKFQGCGARAGRHAVVCFLSGRERISYTYKFTKKRLIIYSSTSTSYVNICIIDVYIAAMLVYEKTRWGFIKAALARSLALELRHRSRANNNKGTVYDM